MNRGFPSRLLLAKLLAVSCLVGCTRTSAPPPAADAASASAPVVTSVASGPSTPAPATATERLAASPAPPASSAAAPPNPWTTPEACAPRGAPPASEASARSQTTCEAREELRAFVAVRQSCTASSGCTIVAGSCPFGCFVPAEKDQAPQVAAKLEELGARLDAAGPRCVYRCMAPPQAVCVDGRCDSKPAP